MHNLLTEQLDTLVLLLVELIGSVIISLISYCLSNDEVPGPQIFFPRTATWRAGRRGGRVGEKRRWERKSVRFFFSADLASDNPSDSRTDEERVLHLDLTEIRLCIGTCSQVGW